MSSYQLLNLYYLVFFNIILDWVRLSHTASMQRHKLHAVIPVHTRVMLYTLLLCSVVLTSVCFLSCTFVHHITQHDITNHTLLFKVFSSSE